MIELFIDQRGELAVENMDELFERFPEYAERAVASALKSEGFNLKEQLKMAVLRGGPEGHKWEKLHPYSRIMSQAKQKWVKNYKWGWSPKQEGKKRQKVKIWLRQQRGAGPGNEQRAGNPLLKFAGGLRYRYSSDDSLLSVGFVNSTGDISQNFAKLIRLHSSGYEATASRDMQKKAWALGMRLGRSSRVRIPARPLVEPVFRAEKDKIVQRIEGKFLSNIARYMAEGKK